MSINRKDSFSDRICDDLCEVLLSYLSFEDKIRFECVSKQWQKCVFVKQFRLKLYEHKVLFNKKRFLNEKAFEIVLKKFQNINVLTFDDRFPNVLTTNTLKLITKYCLHLKEITFNINKINVKTIREFGENCGQELQKIHLIGREREENDIKYKTLIKLSPNLKVLFGVKLSDFVENEDLFLAQLKKVWILKGYQNKELFELFVNKYKKQINYLKCRANKGSHQSIQSFKLIAGFEALEELIISEDKLKLFANCAQSIANNNKNLKTIHYRIHNPNTSYLNKVFNNLNHFKSLSQLSIHMTGRYKGDKQITIKSLSYCKQLQKLSLMYPNLNDNFFKDIHLYCPQLKSLQIFLESEEEDEDLNDMQLITDETLKSLAKLKHLKSFELYEMPFNFSNLSTITDSGLIDLIKKSPQIRKTYFSSRLNITQESINALIELAISKPKIQFNHKLSGFWNKKLFAKIYDSTKYSLPNNLFLEFNDSLDINTFKQKLSYEPNMDSDISESSYSESSSTEEMSD
jgi:hypothetical protein